MRFYLCGHNMGNMFLKKSITELTAYVLWKNSTGFDGDKSECYRCYMKRRKKELMNNE